MPAESTSSLPHYLRTLRRQKWTIALLTLVGTGAALGFAEAEHPVYQSQAQILLEPSQSEAALAGLSSSSPPNLADEIQRLHGTPVAQAVAHTLGYVPKMSASVITGTDVIAVSVTSSSPTQAARDANAYARAYLSTRQTETQSAAAATVSTLESQLRQIEAQMSALGISPTANPTTESPQALALQQEADTLTQRIDSLQLSAALGSGGAEIIQPATAPSSPISPKPVRDGGLGFGGGLILGLGLAFLREQLDETIGNKEDLAAAQGSLPVLGVIPAFPGGRRKAKVDTGLIALTHPHGVVSEACRQVRTALQFLTLERPAQLIQVTSPRTSEGKSTLASNLGVTFAQAGQRVIVIDADLRRPRLQALFSLPLETGFTGVVLGEIGLMEALQPVPDLENLRVLTSGNRPPNPAEILGSRRVGELFEQLRGEADVIVLDSPPVIPVTDAVVLSTRVDATVLVAMVDVTPRRDFARSLELLSQVGAPLVGTVLNRVGPGAEDGYRYGYSYAYSYGAPEEARAARS